MTETAARLHRAIAEWPSASYTRLGPRAAPSVKSFSTLATARGSSRGMLARYFASGPDTPEVPEALLRDAAKLLGVRYGWLKHGTAGMTETMAAHERQIAVLTEHVKAQLDSLLSPAEALFSEHDTTSRALLLDVLAGWEHTISPEGIHPADPAARSLVAAIVGILQEPFRLLGAEPNRTSRHAFPQYVRAMLLALSLAPNASKPLTTERTNNDTRKDA